MSRFISILVALFVLVLIGGFVGLASWDMTVPTKTVEKVIPDGRFPR